MWQVQHRCRAAYTSPAIVHDAVLGRTVIYVGNQVGTISAYDASTGERLWATDLPQAVPVIAGGRQRGALHRLVRPLPVRVRRAKRPADLPLQHGRHRSASPLVVDPDGGGLVIYAGDTALSGNDGGHIWAINAVDPNTPPTAASAGCSRIRRYPQAGSWSPPAFATRRQRPCAGGGRQLQPGQRGLRAGCRTGQNRVAVPDAGVRDRQRRRRRAHHLGPGRERVRRRRRLRVRQGSHRLRARTCHRRRRSGSSRCATDSPSSHSGGRSTAALVDNRLYLGRRARHVRAERPHRRQDVEVPGRRAGHPGDPVGAGRGRAGRQTRP